jgi:succinyl-diaminopimelate desuccinylase
MKGSLSVMLELRPMEPTLRSVEVSWVFYAREEISRSESGLLEIAQLRPDLLDADVAISGRADRGSGRSWMSGHVARQRRELGGKRAHTARPFAGRNAMHRLGSASTDSGSYEPREVSIDGVDVHRTAPGGSVGGGVAPNVVPDLANCTLNHRFAPDRSTTRRHSRGCVIFWVACLEDGDVRSR